MDRRFGLSHRPATISYLTSPDRAGLLFRQQVHQHLHSRTDVVLSWIWRSNDCPSRDFVCVERACRCVWKVLSFIGQHSYPIYVFHLLVIDTLRHYHLLDGPRGVVVYFISSIAFGIVFSRLIEFPVLHLRDRIFPREVAQPASANAAVS